MLVCILSGHIIDTILSVGMKYSSAGLGHDQAFPASCIANNTPQFKSGTRENHLRRTLSVAVFVVQYSAYAGFLQEISPSVCEVSAPEYSSSALECGVANAEAYTVIVFTGRSLYKFHQALVIRLGSVFVSSRCLTICCRMRKRQSRVCLPHDLAFTLFAIPA